MLWLLELRAARRVDVRSSVRSSEKSRSVDLVEGLIGSVVGVFVEE